MNIHVLVVNGVADFGLSAVLDTLNYANQLAAKLDPRPAPLEITLVGTRKRVRTANGFEVPVARFDPSLQPDAIVIPALGALTPEQVEASLERPELRAIKAAVVAKAREGVWVGAACTATFLLAETGLLDGHTATTSWWLAPLFRKRYPRVALDDSRMVVLSAPYVTAGAALAHVDLALGLVRRRSPALAALTARYLLVDSRSSQAVYAIPDHLAHADPLVEKFEGWARRNLANGFSLSEAAHAIGTSQRTLARRLKHTLGKSPLGFFQDLRIEHAVHLLQTGHDSIDRVAEQVGYSDGATLRSLLRRKLGRGVRALRAAA
ncbi:helix-turn-helix domain-containing protein [Burkholderia sp. Bp9143]|uniref:GlxA family transcriptional regulator n=1 Tax=Burkholderia sp. Bp9143 TaxID=2184574 RepID=UPI000F5A03A7|nr:helix-turn-helix domain-containing protein [Burkholderia sp. Bp9143]RQR32379.1 helix-turn-helix domain-containing protein [Burkholderia sp. Bp9143]